ncbi:MAG: hypothetical protein AAF639_04650 [Chloroflexota bacterium]
MILEHETIERKARHFTFMEFDDWPVKTDVMVKVLGIEWQLGWNNRERQSYQEQQFYAISCEDLGHSTEYNTD